MGGDRIGESGARRVGEKPVGREIKWISSAEASQGIDYWCLVVFVPKVPTAFLLQFQLPLLLHHSPASSSAPLRFLQTPRSVAPPATNERKLLYSWNVLALSEAVKLTFTCIPRSLLSSRFRPSSVLRKSPLLPSYFYEKSIEGLEMQMFELTLELSSSSSSSTN